MDLKNMISPEDYEEMKQLGAKSDLWQLYLNVHEWYYVYLKVVCGFTIVDGILQEMAEAKKPAKIHIPTLAYFIFFAQNLKRIPPFKHKKKRSSLKLIADYLKISDKLAEKYFEARRTTEVYLMNEKTDAFKYAVMLIPIIFQLPNFDELFTKP